MNESLRQKGVLATSAWNLKPYLVVAWLLLLSVIVDHSWIQPSFSYRRIASMKIWSDFHSYLNSIRDRYVSHVERFLSDDCEGDDTTDVCVADRLYHNAECESSECQDDCRSADESYRDTQTYFPLDQEYVLCLAEHHLQLANTLHIQPCDASH